MESKILLTGFRPFGKLAINPTERLMRALAGESFPQAAVRTIVLDTDYARCEEQFRQALGPNRCNPCTLSKNVSQCQHLFGSGWSGLGLRNSLAGFVPDAVLSFGLDQRIDQIKLERIAVNIDDAKIADTRGHLRRGNQIAADGPVGYWSTLPLEAIYQALQEAGIPVQFSNHAGAYVCNHIFYYGRHLIETLKLPTRMGFIHVPPLPEQLRGEEGERMGMALETLLRAGRICVEALCHSLQLTG